MLRQSGIKGNTLELFENYHLDRYYMVKIYGDHSDPIRATHGMAQGSILGLADFLTYFNDMFEIFKHASAHQFFDDISLITAHRNQRWPNL